uniref:Ig-like domain-containing protein n=1 Tax=Castor canadensis TaxID=51338 RepID=A0A8C0ZMY2_CASCN
LTHSALFLFPGSLSQPVLTQMSSVSASPGSSARITCTLSSGFKVPGYHIFWYQQKIERSSPKLLIYGNSNRPSGIPECFSGSKSGNSATLTITVVQPEDEADYYCDAYDKSLSARTVLQFYKEVRQETFLFCQ